MPTVDVTELFSDPELASPITVTRRVQSIDGHGRAVNTETVYRIVGVIQPARPRQLAMLPDMTRTAGAVEVWCAFDLTEGQQTTAPDEITWLDQVYTVVNVQGWRNMGGASWSYAMCELKELVAPDAQDTI